MAKVITFSRVFPVGHQKQGQPTYFVEQFYRSIYGENSLFISAPLGVDHRIINKKHHTIRSGNRFKKGDFFSPRVWSDKPYNSKQIIIAPDVEIKQVWDIEIYPTNEVTINGNFFASFGSENWHELCKNDGLSSEDMRSWFSKLPFKGQIICWSDEIKY